MKLSYTETPVHEIVGHPILTGAGIRLVIKREDLNHQTVSGNKWWKLKYNLKEAAESGHKTVLTFGGAYSNHIYATAAASAECGFKSIGIIRGEETLPLNPTLQFAMENGMRLHYISRTTYRDKNDKAFVESLHEKFGPFYLIPEGGSNMLAVRGCEEFASRELRVIDFNHLVLPVGTGGTMSGLICGFAGARNIIGVPVLKDGGFLETAVRNMVTDYAQTDYNAWSIRTHYHHGGYAKVTRELLLFIDEMRVRYQLPLDPVYTAKGLWAVIKEAEAGTFESGTTVLFLHTGGLQSIIGAEQSTAP